MTNKKPNFLIVGAAKSGSSSLYEYLKQHPEVFMPENKEPNFFVSEYQLKMSKDCPTYKVSLSTMEFNEGKYFKLFDKAKDNEMAIGEATTTYLYKPEYAIPKIKSFLGDPKIIIILRNPVKRAFSQYCFACELGFEDKTFMEGIKLEKERLDKNWSSRYAYVDQGRYYSQVKSYMDAFSNVHVILLDEFIKDKQAQMKKVFTFLEIDPTFKNSFAEIYNTSGVPKIKFIQRFLTNDNKLKRILRKLLAIIIPNQKIKKAARKLRTLNQGDKLIMSPEEKEYLEKIYFPEIDQLEKILGKKLDLWKT